MFHCHLGVVNFQQIYGGIYKICNNSIQTLGFIINAFLYFPAMLSPLAGVTSEFDVFGKML